MEPTVATSEEPDGLHLTYLMLLPEYQGRGIGSELIREVIAGATTMGRPLLLHVLKVNKRAQGFYHRHGFEIVGDIEGRHVMQFRGQAHGTGSETTRRPEQ